MNRQGQEAFREVYRTAFNPRRVSVNSPSLLPISPDRLGLWYFGGSWEGREDVALWSQTLSRSRDGTWHAGPERMVLQVPGHTIGNAIPIMGADGRLWLFVVVSQPGSWDASQIWRMVSTDGGLSYGTPVPWKAVPGTMVGTPALPAPDGTWLLPLYSEVAWNVWTVRLGGRDLDVLDEGPAVTTPGGCIQLCLTRTGRSRIAGFLRTRDGCVYRTDSSDGLHLSVPRPIGLPNPNARVAATAIGLLASGELVLIYNPASEGRLHLEREVFSSGRTCLRAALSQDGGQTFPRRLRRDLVLGTGEYAYPWAVSLGDSVMLAFQALRSQICVVEFTRTWFTEEHPLTSPETFQEASDDLRAEESDSSPAKYETR